MTQLLTYPDIDPQQWQALIDRSPYATWFQTPEAYEFYASNPDEMTPFAFGVVEDECKVESVKFKGEENSKADTPASTLYTLHPTQNEASTPYTLHPTPTLKGVIVGYITRERNALKQFLTRRAIIIGGPLLDEHISDEALSALLSAVAQCKVESVKFKGEENSKADTPASTPYTLHPTPIYIETRNFHDYSKWKEIFAECGFDYIPHLNFHIDTSSVELVESRLGKNRKRDIKTSIRDGATIVENPTIERVREYYTLLKQLYTTKIKTPLFSLSFFEKLYAMPSGRFILVELNDEIIGGTVCVELARKCLYEWFVCGRDGEWKSIFPSSLATYAGIRYAAEHGCNRFDMMGAGKPDEAYGVRDFKARFGGEQVEHGRFLCVRKQLLYWIGKMGVKLLKKR